MSIYDWIVLIGTLGLIIGYGTWKSRGSRNIEGYLRGDSSMKWATIGLSVMATQASAITFLSTPGLAYESGMAFVQNYLGLPIALIIVSTVFLPIYYKLKVYTAYEYLETRFDVKTRSLAAGVFLVQRGMSAGITIYAPAIILSKVLELNLTLTIVLVGTLVIIYTVSGGTKAVSLTQKYQMIVIFLGMFVAYFILVNSFPEFLSFGDALNVAGAMGKLEAIDFSFDFEKRYTFWSGITGGLFLSLGYFGTDQSQVQRYIGGSNVRESRMGLMFNAVLKIPMQFFILFVGVMLFVFYQFEKPPIFFNTSEKQQIENTAALDKIDQLEVDFNRVHEEKQEAIVNYVEAERALSSDLDAKREQMIALNDRSSEIRDEYRSVLLEENPSANTKDYDYIFITFVMNFLPVGVIGLLLAVIFSAAMSSTSSELNALGSTTVIDFYKRLFKREGNDRHYLNSSRLITGIWGVIAILFALAAQLVENLIEFVNIIGSLFYGTVLGIFIVAFFVKWVRSYPVFIAAIIVQISILIIHLMVVYKIIVLSYLMYNVIACLGVVILAVIFEAFSKKRSVSQN